MAFKLGTSGFVEGRPQGIRTKRFYWSDLDAFRQGYVEALLTSFQEVLAESGRLIPERAEDRFGFSDLAPETLARIMEDCGRRLTHIPHYRREDDARNAEYGCLFWTRRQAGDLTSFGFPPLTPYLADDGKVHLKESPRA